jgi:hypothetical protein
MSAPELPIEVIPAEIKPKDKRLEKMLYRETLPKHPANIMILGRCGSGKSCCLYSMLKNGYVDAKGKSIFDEIIVYLGTLDAEEAFEKLPCKNVAVLHEYNDDEFQQYLDDLKQHQMERLEKGKPPLNTAIVFDDFVGQALLKHNKGKASALERLALTSRHECNASLFFCSQTYKNNGLANPTVRNNITQWIIYNMGRSELEKIAEDHCNHLTEDEFVRLAEGVFSKPHRFMMVNYKKPDAERFTLGFTTVIGKKQSLQNRITDEREEISVNGGA